MEKRRDERRRCENEIRREEKRREGVRWLVMEDGCSGVVCAEGEKNQRGGRTCERREEGKEEMRN